MPGNLTLDELKKAVKSGEIDTVIAAGIDMQGRLMGKRFHAQFFVDGGWEETHCCNYLLTVDMEMNTVQGYKSSSWETGYGDYTLKPDLRTLRRIPWLPGTALVLGDTQDHATHADVPHAPRSILKKQVERARAMGFEPMMATELEFYLFENSYENLRDGGLNALRTVGGYNEDYHIFQTTKEEDVMRAVRNGLYGAGIPIENTKGVWDGVVPYVIGSTMAIPNMFTVRMQALRVLRDKMPAIVDAMEPGGSGDPYAGLSEHEASVLREIETMGFPMQSWFGWRTMGLHGFAADFPLLK